MMKDYLDYYPMQEEHFDFNYVTDNSTTSLVVKATLPKFKTQLINDYPNLKYARLIFNVYLIPDRNFNDKFKECGYAAID